MGRSSHPRALALSGAAVIASLALIVPTIALAATTTVPAIPGGGWAQSPENTASVTIAASPAGGTGTSALKFVTTGTSSKLAVVHALLGPLSDLSGASWNTYATGTSSSLNSEPPSLRFTMYRLGGTSEFTSMIVERTYQGTVHAGAWEANTLSGTTSVWQSNGPGFCDQNTRCTLNEFKEQYPNATLLGVQVAVGSGVPVLTSYADNVSVQFGESSDTWNFEKAAATPKPTVGATRTPHVTTPPTDADARVTGTPSVDNRIFLVLGVASLVGLALVRPRRSRRTR
jgi:hypothetical protein